jgi:hypothetical protein
MKYDIHCFIFVCLCSKSVLRRLGELQGSSLLYESFHLVS